ncbi:FadR/GntR family transcriptional regulator [Bounagaea algeriensis]
MAKPNTARDGLRVQRIQAAYRQVADQLKSQIISGALASGTRLPSESELASMFGVSRSTVREALRLLASQNLIDTTRGVNGGSFVAVPNTSAVADDLGGTLGLLVNSENLTVAHLLEARLILEPVAARLAAEHGDKTTLAELRQTLQSTPDRDPSRGFEVRWDFHSTLVAATANPLLRMMCQPINEVLHSRLHRNRIAQEAWERIDGEHVLIHQAVEEGDGAKAERLTREHLHSLRPLYEQMGEPDD